MTIATAKEARLLLKPTAVPPKTPLRAYGWKSVAGATVALLVLTAILLPGSLALSAIAVPIAIAGALYAAVLLPITLLRWRAAGQVVAGATDDELALVEGFSTPSQRLTFVFSAVLSANLLLAAILLAVGPAGTIAAWLFIFVGLVAELVGVGSAWANARWLYRPSYVVGEHDALANRRGAWKLILANRILTCTMWVGYIVGAVVYCVHVL